MGGYDAGTDETVPSKGVAVKETGVRFVRPKGFDARACLDCNYRVSGKSMVQWGPLRIAGRASASSSSVFALSQAGALGQRRPTETGFAGGCGLRSEREGQGKVQHPTSNIQHPTSNIQHPTSNSQRQQSRHR
jgi:hypothetical protein